MMSSLLQIMLRLRRRKKLKKKIMHLNDTDNPIIDAGMISGILSCKDKYPVKVTIKRLPFPQTNLNETNALLCNTRNLDLSNNALVLIT